MIAIFKREFSSYMRNVTGPLFVAVMLLFGGVFLFVDNLVYGYPKFEYTLNDLKLVLILAIPVLAMRSLAEDKRSRVDQLLYSLPMSLSQVVIGKYLAMLAVLGLPCLVMTVYPLIMSFFGAVNYVTAYCALFAFFMMSAALLALCMFLSSLTESQIIAAVIGVAGVLLLFLIDGIAMLVPTQALSSLIALAVVVLLICLLLWFMTKNWRISVIAGVVAIGVLLLLYVINAAMFEGLFAKVVSAMSLFGRFTRFDDGIFDLGAIVYNLSFIVFFLYLTYQVLEKKRWS